MGGGGGGCKDGPAGALNSGSSYSEGCGGAAITGLWEMIAGRERGGGRGGGASGGGSILALAEGGAVGGGGIGGGGSDVFGAGSWVGAS